ncbi:unnamed protein product [Vitrella brassicaformis CCMP3155]|uniref:Uncharacterized protein n=1 Tax=Vitrella brassicaformis (strain CCMP3155) TaxID=1169540 RepID=A0A0G4G507_VITBC|nr:unnamed protein product [Vitrella brassicaformis CCMP3155]|eukprot:CEM23186.1 unnamed protein product [Vitrella brassicaformis CCMP3155]
MRKRCSGDVCVISTASTKTENPEIPAMRFEGKCASHDNLAAICHEGGRPKIALDSDIALGSEKVDEYVFSFDEGYFKFCWGKGFESV